MCSPLHCLCLSIGKTICKSKHQCFPSPLACMMLSHMVYQQQQIVLLLPAGELPWNSATEQSDTHLGWTELPSGPALLSALARDWVWTPFRWPACGQVSLSLNVSACALQCHPTSGVPVPGLCPGWLCLSSFLHFLSPVGLSTHCCLLKVIRERDDFQR